MKKVISVSIGSSLRDHRVETQILNEKYTIERIGTNGSIPKAITLIKALDGQVDALGLGGIDLYLSGANRKFMIKEAIPIVEAAKKTPIVDGTGLKNTLEKNIVEFLAAEKIIDFSGKKVLLVCAIDRFKMAESFIDMGCTTILGDIIFALGIPIPIKSISVFKKVVSTFLPIISRLPFNVLYPVGEKHNGQSAEPDRYTQAGKAAYWNFERFYNDADIIAGDFLYIKKYLPENLYGKIIITNTVAQADVDMLKQRGVSILVTSTPEFNGRSFGTNVMEAVLIAAAGKRPEQLSTEDYMYLIKKMNFAPRIEYLNK
ncbi:MAG: quinate 5-dehydrogenase [Firmicutes bacterium]|nr:quinate 5-dehydrogenase [Bacillota bacterium]